MGAEKSGTTRILLQVRPCRCIESRVVWGFQQEAASASLPENNRSTKKSKKPNCLKANLRIESSRGRSKSISGSESESKSRSGYLAHACDVLLEKLPGDRVCGIARNIGRDGEVKEIMTLEKLKEYSADMFSTVFIGNSSTQNIDDFMVTARGYKSEQ